MSLLDNLLDTPEVGRAQAVAENEQNIFLNNRYLKLLREGKFEEARASLQAGYVPSEEAAPAASAASAASVNGLLSSALGLEGPDAVPTLRRLLSDFKRREAEAAEADVGHYRDGSGNAPGDEDYNYGGGLASIHRADLKMSDKDIFKILAGDRPTYDFKKLGGGLLSGAIEGLTTLHGQNKYDQAEELKKIRNSIFDMGVEGMGVDGKGKFAIGTSEGAGTGIYADLEAGGTPLQKEST